MCALLSPVIIVNCTPALSATGGKNNVVAAECDLTSKAPDDDTCACKSVAFLITSLLLPIIVEPALNLRSLLAVIGPLICIESNAASNLIKSVVFTEW